MKTIRHILLAAALALALGSCIKDNPADAEGTPVRITLSADAQNSPEGASGTATRAPQAGDAADRTISSLRVLGYRADGSLAFNSRVPDFTPASNGGFTGDILVKTGRYSLVFIANETSDPALSAALAGLAPDDGSLIHMLNDLYFSHTAFDSAKAIPMIARADGVLIIKTADGSPAIGAANGQSTFAVTMRRLGIRLDLAVTLYGAQFNGWFNAASADGGKSVRVERVPDRVYLFGKDNSASYGSVRSVEYTGVNPAADVQGRKTFTIPRVILPETLFAPAGSADKALRLSLWDGTRRITGTIHRTGTTDHTVPRNTFLAVTANASEWEMAMTATVADWNDTSMNGSAEGRYYTVTVNAPADAATGSAASDAARQLSGGTVTVLANPAPGMAFSHWDAAGVTLADASANPAAFTMPAANVTLTPVFGVAQPYTVAVATVANGSASADRATAWPGQMVTLSASPNPNFVFSHYTVTRSSDGAAIPVTANSFTMPAADVTVTPVFGDRLYKIDISMEQGMSVTANDALSEAALNGSGVVAGTQVTLTAACNVAGYAFAGWDQYGPSWLHPNDPAYVADGFTWVTTSTITFTMLAATDQYPNGGRKIALFRQPLYRVNATSTIGGTTGVTYGGGYNHDTGSIAGWYCVYAAESVWDAANGVNWYFSHWSGDGSTSNEEPRTRAFQVNNANPNPSITANYYRGYRATVKFNINGTVQDGWDVTYSDSRLTSSGVPSGGWHSVSVSEIFTRNGMGYRFVNWQTSDGTVLTTNELCSFQISGDLTLTANYTAYVLCPSTAPEVVIGDLVWAGSNLNGDKSFAPYPTDYGAYFLYGTNVVLPWGGFIPEIYVTQIWAAEKDPCPAGWRIPTRDEWQPFRNKSDNGGAYATITIQNASLILPYSGRARANSGTAPFGNLWSDQGEIGTYWSDQLRLSSTGSALSYGTVFRVFKTSYASLQSSPSCDAAVVRCVRPK